MTRPVGEHSDRPSAHEASRMWNRLGDAYVDNRAKKQGWSESVRAEQIKANERCFTVVSVIADVI